MRLALDTWAAIIRGLPELGVDQIRKWGGRKFPEERQAFLLELLTSSYEHRRPHAAYHDADTFSRDFLVRGLRADRGSYSDLLRPFYEFPEGNQGYSAEYGWTKWYKLRPRPLAVLDSIYSGSEPLPVNLLDDDGNVLPIEQLPSNGLPRTVSQELSVPSIIRLERASIDQALKSMADWRARQGESAPLNPNKPNGWTVREGMRQVTIARRFGISIGGIPNFYDVQSNGRLGPEGFHLIKLPSRLRSLLFDNSGLFDYDFVSCHWMIALSLARALGIQTPVMDDYVANRPKWFTRWTGITGHTIHADFKRVATSLLNGGNLSSSPRTANAQCLGTSAMRALGEDIPTRSLYNEVKRLMGIVVNHVPTREFDGTTEFVANAVGAHLVLDKKQNGNRRGRLSSHLLTGLEQFAIREACSQARGVQAIIYDGFIAPRQQTSTLEATIRARSEAELKFRLDLSLNAEELRAPDYSVQLPRQLQMVTAPVMLEAVA